MQPGSPGALLPALPQAACSCGALPTAPGETTAQAAGAETPIAVRSARMACCCRLPTLP